jgi:heterodisulfide reductase subunit A
MLSLTIDGKLIEISPEMTILNAAEIAKIHIPTLCYNPLLKPNSACRVCIVEVVTHGVSNLVTACSTKVENGMIVFTQSDRAVTARRMNLELMLAQAPAAEVVQRLASEIGVEKTRFPIIQANNKCILCGTCVRICDEIVGAHALSFSDRGIYREISTPFHDMSEDCILCGACARYCPTGHIKMTEIEGRIHHPEIKLGPNTAITLPFRQAIPNVPRIHKNFCIHMETGGCMLCSKVCPKECINYEDEDKIEEYDIGAIIMATGFQDFNPTPLKQFGYGKYPNILTAIEFEQMNNAGSTTGGKIVMDNGQEPRSIAILHCIGSRDENQHKYCSKVCCMYALKFAHLVKEKTNAEVFQFYIDMRTAGKGYEEFYQRLLEEGIHIIRGKGAEVVPTVIERINEGELTVHCEDTLIGKFREIPVDMVILCTALEPIKEAKEIARKFNIATDAEGWFIEAHPKLAPVSTTTDGVFLAGVCQGPKDIPDTVAQGKAAAGSVVAIFNQGELLMDAAYAVVHEENCGGCKICNGICPYSAISFDEEKKVSVINAAMCKACGTCVAACPSGAIKGKHFTDEQIYAQIEGILA